MTAPRDRLIALDVFRGLTVAGMLLVNDPGSWGNIYAPLEHAAWHGWTPTDLIFPFFLFIVGVTTHLSLSARRARGDDDAAIRRQIIRRGALIFLCGFLMNGFPFFTWGDIAGVAHPTFLERLADRPYHWRLLGVLQRIGLVYVAAGLLTARATVKRRVVMIVAILIGYWFAMTLLPVPGSHAPGYLTLDDPSRTMAAWWDRYLLDWTRFGLGNHIWSGSVTYDPEGFFSTLPAIATTILGTLAGKLIADGRPIHERLSALFAAGALGMVAGLIWNWSFPINKNLWTSSYVLFTAGVACVALATIIWMVDVQRITKWTTPLVVYGSNPLVAFAGSGVMARLIYSIWFVQNNGARVPLVTAIYQSVFATWLAPKNASLAFALSFVLFWYAILFVLYRKKIFVKI